MLPAISLATTTAHNQSLSTREDVQQGNRQAPADSTPVEDDCFCCCAHIVLVESYKFPPIPCQTAPIESDPGNIPATPFTELFRPPRFA